MSWNDITHAEIAKQETEQAPCTTRLVNQLHGEQALSRFIVELLPVVVDTLLAQEGKKIASVNGGWMKSFKPVADRLWDKAQAIDKRARFFLDSSSNVWARFDLWVTDKINTAVYKDKGDVSGAYYKESFFIGEISNGVFTSREALHGHMLEHVKYRESFLDVTPEKLSELTQHYKQLKKAQETLLEQVPYVFGDYIKRGY